jgi:hypothetical protein
LLLGGIVAALARGGHCHVMQKGVSDRPLFRDFGRIPIGGPFFSPDDSFQHHILGVWTNSRVKYMYKRI